MPNVKARRRILGRSLVLLPPSPYPLLQGERVPGSPCLTDLGNQFVEGLACRSSAALPCHRSPLLESRQPIVQLFRLRPGRREADRPALPNAVGGVAADVANRERVGARLDDQGVGFGQRPLARLPIPQKPARTRDVTAEQGQQSGVAARHSPSLAGRRGGLKFGK
jgi:hypothetical protein